MTLVRAALWRLFHPRRTIKPTRDGWWCLLVAVGLGVAAINTGNNLLYLLVSALLALIVVSGILSEQSMRGLDLTGVAPDEMYAGQPALLGATIANRKGWFTSYSVTVELLASEARALESTSRFIYVRRVEAGRERLVTWEETLPRRGRHRLTGVRITTRFPFGLFVKAARPALADEVVVFPAVRPVSAESLRRLGESGEASARRRGRGNDLYNLRGYRAGDDPRFIHWRSSAKTEGLMVRELEADTSQNTRLVLVGRGRRGAETLERGLSEAASLAVALVRAGAGVELAGPDCEVPLGHGRAHLRRMLTALALYDTEAPRAVPAPPSGAEARRTTRPLREIRIALA
ncbi:MAG TPA: DUF58 domain-containing protein [Candidatus Dormibacteraeota bacterium]|nr:DUF58 domain-containing protein [Candidatus Dormibacteraeota bacterium]